MKEEERQELLDELREIQDELLEDLEKARRVIRELSKINGDRMAYERADAYWLAHAKMALTNNHSYLGGSMVTMDDTISELEGGDEE